MIDISQSKNVWQMISANISHSIAHTNRRKFEWNLPRQVGATVFIAYKALADILVGRAVAVVGEKHAIEAVRRVVRFELDKLKSQVEVTDSNLSRIQLDNYGMLMFVNITRNGSWLNRLRGSSLSRLYLDNPLYSMSTEDLKEFYMSYVPVLAPQDGYILALNTTEGEAECRLR